MHYKENSPQFLSEEIEHKAFKEFTYRQIEGKRKGFRSRKKRIRGIIGVPLARKGFSIHKE